MEDSNIKNVSRPTRLKKAVDFKDRDLEQNVSVQLGVQRTK